MNGALLADAIDPTDTLLDDGRRPWQLEVDDVRAAEWRFNPSLATSSQ